jgi:phospholipase C
MRRLKIAFQIAGIPGSRGVKALAASRSVSPPISMLALVRALCEQGTLHKVDHFFVLVLENRSFDHILGFSGISGMRPDSGENRPIDGLTQKFANVSNVDSQTIAYSVEPTAPFVLEPDIAHEFDNVKRQLCGNISLDTPYSKETITNSGFVLNRENPPPGDSPLPKDQQYNSKIKDPMRCFSREHLPVLTKLAEEFVVCDRWFSSLPGPTSPNRLFFHAATSGGMTRSLQWYELLATSTSLYFGFQPANGSIFDRLNQKGLPWYLYAGDRYFNMSTVMQGITQFDFDELEDLAEDLRDPTYDGAYTFIEPAYDPLDHYEDGNSMHPSGDVREGERLVKDVYEAIRNSPLWERSVLIITFDEHGGFYDHVPPGTVAAPGDTAQDKPERNFDFTRLGLRVPAIIVSPLIPKNMVDDTIYDHTSIFKTLAMRFGLQHLTQRDAHANPFSHLFQLTTPRQDTPTKLPEPFSSSVLRQPSDAASARLFGGRRPDEFPVDALPPSIKNFIALVALADLKLRGPEGQQEVRQTVSNLRTLGEARRYVESIRAREHGRMMEEGGKRRRHRRSQTSP